MLFGWRRSFLVSHFDIDERNNLGLQTIFRGLDHNYELLTHLRSNLESDLLLELLGERILYEPAAELDLGIFDERPVLVLERQFLAIVLAENAVTIKLLLS